MYKSELKEEDEVAVQDPKCTNNVYRGIVTCITKSPRGIWVAVNYRYGLLPSVCARNEDKWVLLRTDGKSIVSHWDRYQSIIDQQTKDRMERDAKLTALRERVDKVVEKLKERGISCKSSLGMITVSFEDMEILLGGRNG